MFFKYCSAALGSSAATAGLIVLFEVDDDVEYNLDIAKKEVQKIFERRRKGRDVIDMNHKLLDAGYTWAIEHLDERFDVPAEEREQDMVVMSGNAAVAMGAMAAGIEVCSMYPITPATDILRVRTEHVGGVELSGVTVFINGEPQLATTPADFVLTRFALSVRSKIENEEG